MSGPASFESDCPVLIAGGGLIGLSPAMFLAQHGIPSLAVERLRGGSQLPRAAFFHMRTLEMFRAAGIEDEVREQSRKEFEPEGALIIMDTLAGKKDRKSTRLNSSHLGISYAVFCLKKKK